MKMISFTMLWNPVREARIFRKVFIPYINYGKNHLGRYIKKTRPAKLRAYHRKLIRLVGKIPGN